MWFRGAGKGTAIDEKAERPRERPMKVLVLLAKGFETMEFSVFIDVGMALPAGLASENYLSQMIMCVAGCAVLGLGISMVIGSNVTVLPGEGIVIAIAYRFKKIFGRIKVLFDVSLVALSVALSFAFLSGLVGIREGTVLSALLVGNFVRLTSPAVRKLDGWFAA